MYKGKLFKSITTVALIIIILFWVKLTPNMLMENMISSIILSFLRVTIATVISCILSLGIGLLIIKYKTLDNLIYPFIKCLRFIPIITIYPLLIITLGISELMVITLLLSTTLFYFLPINVQHLKSVSIDIQNLAKAMGINKNKLVFNVVLPKALPNICSSFLTVYGISWTYIVIAETIGTHAGLGSIINLANISNRFDVVLLGLAIVFTIGYSIDIIGNILINNIFKWNR